METNKNEKENKTMKNNNIQQPNIDLILTISLDDLIDINEYERETREGINTAKKMLNEINDSFDVLERL